MHPIVRVEHLSKRYRIGRRERYRTLRESLIETAAAPVRGLKTLFSGNGNGSASEDHVWALDDVSFEVKRGEVLGLIGRNGSGKSTLLKILSRITEPTRGTAQIYGRVGSLLEVGTGFHPELTGLENIYLSGAILGMRRAEIARKFDEIVSFAEVDQFIDTPVKHFSSGMYVRLAFAVAAHLEPEILLVDEVLAVGDAAFQKKCLGKMGDVARAGRTVLFVSHNMASIQSLCATCLILSAGRIAGYGQPTAMVDRYTATELGPSSGHISLLDHPGRRGDSTRLMNSVTLMSCSEDPTGTVSMGATLSVRVAFSSREPIRPTLGVNVKTAQGAPVFGVNNRWTNQGINGPRLSNGTITCTLERLPLMPGSYSIDLDLGDFADITRDHDVITDAILFEVYPADLFGTGQLPRPSDGPVFCNADWTAAA
jgi:lipopolysaccharide transport system ATP-binding protein